MFNVIKQIDWARLVAQWGKRSGATWLFIFVACFGGLTLFQQKSLDREMNRAEINLLNAFDFYSQFLRNVRSITQHYDMLLANTKTGEAVEEAGQKNIESLMVQNSFGSGQEYFVLRGANGVTHVEIRRGNVRTDKSDIQIEGEKEFGTLSDVFLSRSCRINGITHYCLIDIPNRREFVTADLRTYSVVALTLPEAALYARYKPTSVLWPLQTVQVMIKVDNETTKLNSIGSKMNFLIQEKTVGDGIKIVAGYNFLTLLLSSFFFSVLLGTCVMCAWYFLENEYSKRVHLHTTAALVQDKLKHYDDTKLLIRGVVHDIRSPLSALGILTNMIVDPNASQLLDLLSRRMKLIVNDLEMKESQIGQNTASALPLDQILRLIVTEKNNEFGNEAKVRYEGPEEGCWILGNYSSLLRLLSNLINNAKEASVHPCEIIVRLIKSPKEYTVQIEDHGKGIPSERIDRVFDLGTSFEKEGGTGFGLYFARNAIQKMGGRLLVSSSVGVGSVFSIKIPAHLTPPWVVESLNLSGIRRIVVVDDEAYVYDVWKRKVEGTGLQVQYYIHPKEVPVELLNRSDTFLIVDNNFGTERGEGARFFETYRTNPSILMTSEWMYPEVQALATRARFLLLGKEFINLTVVKIP